MSRILNSTAACWLVLLTSLFLQSLSGQTAPRTLHSAWFERAPYQMEEERRDARVLTGLEVQLLQRLARDTGLRVEFDAASWSEQMDRFANAEEDVIIGAYLREERPGAVHYSPSYREERNTLFIRRSMRSETVFEQLDDLLNWLRQGTARAGVAEGYVYANAELEDFLTDPANSKHVRSFRDEREMLEALLEEQVDAIIADPLVINALLGRIGDRRSAYEHPLDLGRTEVHFIFNRDTLSPEAIEALDQQLRNLLDSGEVLRMQRDFLLPTFLSIATTERWFFILNLMGIAAFSMSGILLARKGRYNFFGALILAATPAVGGGLVRDLLIGQTPVFFIETPVYILLVVGLVIIGTALFNLWDTLRPRFFEQSAGAERWAMRLYERLFKVFDAWAVAAFTVIGVGVAAENQIAPLWLWGPVLGVITASFGVILRDMVRADHDIRILKKDSYGEISILIGIVYALFLLRPGIALNPNAIVWTTFVAIAAGFSLRLWIIFKDWPNPLQLGNRATAPEKRFGEYLKNERQLWHTLQAFIPEVRGVSRPQTHAELESLHNDIFSRIDTCHTRFRNMTRETLGENDADRLLRLQNRLERIRRLEEDLYALANDTPAHWNTLDQACWESLHAVIEAITETLDDPDPINIEILSTLATADPQRFERLRREHGSSPDPDNESAIQRSYRFQRLFALLSEFVNLYVTDHNRIQ